MGQCTGKALDGDADEGRPFHAALTDSRSTADTPASAKGATTPALSSFASLWPSPFPWSAAPSPVAVAITPSPAKCTPRRHLGRPPSPAKHIKSSLAKRFGRLPKTTEAPIPEDGGCRGGTEPEAERPSLEKRFGYDKNFRAKYEMGKEVGKGHFGHVYMARSKKGELKGQLVAVKVISKAKMKTAISIEDVRWEVKILKCLSGHKNMVQFYEAFEDDINVYIVMELCEGGELLDRILSRGGQHTEKDAKIIIIQILSVISFCHLQGVVHRDLKPENFLFTTGDKNAAIKIIDFGLSAFIRPDERLNDIVGSAYYVAPEVLHRSYNTEADMWSIGVIAYILLCGNRPFWARTESGIFRAVLRANPKFNDFSWPAISTEAKDFVRRLLSKDYRKRMSAAKALSHPWLREVHQQIPLDMFIYKSVKAYLRTTPFKRAALKVEFFPLEALSKSLPEDELIYIRTQFELLEPNNKDCISLDNFRLALWRNSTEAMTESRMPNILNALEPLSYRSMDFEEFCAATVSPYQLEALQDWEPIATRAYHYFEQDGNRIISIHELAQEMNILAPAAYCMVRDWIRPGDGKLSFLGFTKLLHGVTIRSSKTARYHC